ncbi:hemolysin family protein [Halalkalicoccus subterraneus]|uniref:hemolysin family protein n=1 Tax=Halalkalicoccus subterraneus TaxID=2675002 RepID=UPI000EFCCADE|nr:hemolysin family protein [Halalkalicoccus subterraneus]
MDLSILAQTDLFGFELTTTMITVIGSLAIVVLIALSAFFSSSEIAMFSLAEHRVDAMAEEGLPGAEMVAALKEDPHRLLVTILVGNNLVNIAMTAISTSLLSLYFGGAIAAVLSTFGITALVLLFGESGPKSYAVEHTETWSRRVARPLKVAEYVMYPLIVVFDYLTRQINRLTGSQGGAIEEPYVTRSEIQDMLETGEREGVIEEDEHDMLQRIFRFTDTIAKEVMTPRLDMTAVSADATIEEAIQTAVQSGHERLPVYDGNLDNVIGIATIRDLVREHNYGDPDIALADLTTPTLHVPESKNVDELLAEMREDRLKMVIVIDEFGTTEGLVTMEDLVEEVVGEILEGGEDEPVEHVNETTVVVRGEVNIDEVNEALEIDLPEGEEFETIAGFVFNRAGRLVEEGESIAYGDIEITVETVENTRIMKARVEKGAVEPPEDPEEIDQEIE